MHTLRNLSFAILVAALTAVVPAQAAESTTTLGLDLPGLGASKPVATKRHHTQASLLLESNPVRAGDTVWAAVRLKMDAHWHTYWRNPGESGMATKIDWELPSGVTAGEIQWPAPEKLILTGATTYVYKDEVVLLVPLTLAGDLSPSPLELKATVSWLECEELCLPGSQKVNATLVIGQESKPSTDTARFTAWKKRIPQTTTPHTAYWEGMTPDLSRSLVFEWTSPTKLTTADFYAYSADSYEVSTTTEFMGGKSPTNRLRLTVTKYDADWPTQIPGLLVSDSSDATQPTKTFVATTLELTNEATITDVASPTVAVTNTSSSLWQMLLFAFLGGLILNIMPCVLPVIALKILGFVGQAREHPHRVRKLGLIYAAGVLVSFLVLAALVIGVKTAGHQAGWGMQFRSPVFIVILAALVTLVALNLFGVFEVTMSGAAMNTMDRLAGRHGNTGAFFNGVLATTLATPCSAPFLAPALGFAFIQSAPVIVIFFLCIGAGLAMPYVVLSCQPAWLKLLPKPGPWMEKFKVAMGFPMLATTVWLYDVASAFYGDRTWWLGIFLVLLALGAWIYGTFIQRGTRGKPFAWAAMVFLLATGYLYALEMNLRWRTVLEDLGSISLQESADGIAWQKWSPAAVAAAHAEGRPVLVDFTARWCTTCRVNKSTALEIPSVREKLKAINAVALLGDYTKFPDDITEELARFGRAAVPLVLVYPADASQPPQILPALLTPGIVLEALDNAAAK